MVKVMVSLTLVNTNTDFEGEINLDGGIASSLYGIEETLGGTNTTLFAVGDQMTDGSKPGSFTHCIHSR